MTPVMAPEREAAAPPSPQMETPAEPHLVTTAEWNMFQAEDRQAAAMVAGIMLAIFTAAVVMYGIIAFIASGG
jgi:hypothetical protein